jgi:glycosyltransferase involved in cell wall biosynthesis
LPASALALIGTGRPIVYRQISDPEVWAASWPRRIRSAALLRRMDAVVALSAASSVTLKRHYWLHARPVVAVIPNAVPEGRFRPPSADERVEARRGLGLPDDAQVIVVVGALVAEKGIDFAIEASAQLPAAVLLVVGDGPDRPALQALAARRMPDRCLFVGALDDPRVAYWSGDVFVSPSLTEVMPAVLIEAGLCGLASVATDVGAVREVVEDQTTGLVVPSRNSEALVSAISLLMTDPSRRLEMGTAAAKRCSSRFTIAPVALMWLDLLYCVRTVGRTGSKR